MKILHKESYADYKKNKTNYDLLDVSEFGLAVLERFNPASETYGATFTCESVVLIKGKNYCQKEEVLCTLWTVRRLVALDIKKKEGIVESYDMFIIAAKGLAYRLASLKSETASPNYHLAILDEEDSIYSDLCVRTSIIHGIDVETDNEVLVETPSWFLAVGPLVNPLL
jgi:hypothetical protein